MSWIEQAKENRQWFHGIEHLVRRPDGYVFWKERSVEHFTHRDDEASEKAARRLADKCRLLESKGLPVTGRTVLCQAALEAPADTPWLNALMHYYAFFENRDGTVSGVFYTHTNRAEPLEALSVGKRADGSIRSQHFSCGYMARRFAENRGAVSLGCGFGYETFEGIMQRMSLTPAELAGLLPPAFAS